MISSIDNGKRWKSIEGNLLAQASGVASTLGDFRLGNLSSRVAFLELLACEKCECNKTEPFMLLCTKGLRFYGESCVCNSFHISYFHVCWSVVTRVCWPVVTQFRRRGDTRRNFRVRRKTTFCSIVCCEWLWLERFCIFKDLFKAL